MKPEREPLFCYCLAIGGREFVVQVSHDGHLLWDDYQKRREDLDSTGKLPPVVGGVLALEPDEFTVSFKLDRAMLARFREAAALFQADAWTVEHESELDRHLVPLFWERVNAKLAQPLPDTDTPRQSSS